MRAVAVQVREEDSLGELALALGTAPNAHAAYEALRRFVQSRTPMNGLFVALYDPARETRRCAYAFSDGRDEDASGLPEMPMNDSPTSRAIRERRPFLTEDFQSLTRALPRVDICLDVDPRIPQCSLAVPMMAHGRVLGALEIQSCERQAFRDHDVAALQLAANLAALAVENLTLRDEREAKLDAARAELHKHTIARGLVRHMLQDITHRGRVPPTVLRQLGRELAEGSEGASIDELLASYAAMGLGDVRAEIVAAGRYTFRARELLELMPGAIRPTCWLTLGFLEGAVAKLEGRASLGTELACCSQGAHECRFMVAARAT